jgi:hypothetical protein
MYFIWAVSPMPGVPVSGFRVVAPRPIYQVQGRLQLLYEQNVQGQFVQNVSAELGHTMN